MGKFIVFEGTDGSGKSTQIASLAKKLTDNGEKVYITAEPTVSLSGGILRDALAGITQKSPSELAVLFAWDRINHNVNKYDGIEKLLSEGYTVLCDRYYYSSLAYQGKDAGYEWVKSLNIGCKDIRKPDLCFFLDVSPKVSMERINSGRQTKEIYEKEDQLTQIRQTFYKVIDDLNDNIVIINAEEDMISVSNKIYEEYQKAFKNTVL
ncbi:MAG: dTMP kinase [Ruminococcaceae bacterium]|nr:dTMP kinase [Oscillospiraceae bacterium]